MNSTLLCPVRKDLLQEMAESCVLAFFPNSKFKSASPTNIDISMPPRDPRRRYFEDEDEVSVGSVDSDPYAGLSNDPAHLWTDPDGNKLDYDGVLAYCKAQGMKSAVGDFESQEQLAEEIQAADQHTEYDPRNPALLTAFGDEHVAQPPPF